jgi:hypothetical protein
VTYFLEGLSPRNMFKCCTKLYYFRLQYVRITDGAVLWVKRNLGENWWVCMVNFCNSRYNPTSPLSNVYWGLFHFFMAWCLIKQWPRLQRVILNKAQWQLHLHLHLYLYLGKFKFLKRGNSNEMATARYFTKFRRFFQALKGGSHTRTQPDVMIP